MLPAWTKAPIERAACGDGTDRGAVDGLGPLDPGAVGETPGRPQLGQHHEVGAALGGDQVDDPGAPASATGSSSP